MQLTSSIYIILWTYHHTCRHMYSVGMIILAPRPGVCYVSLPQLTRFITLQSSVLSKKSPCKPTLLIPSFSRKVQWGISSWGEGKNLCAVSRKSITWSLFWGGDGEADRDMGLWHPARVDWRLNSSLKNDWSLSMADIGTDAEFSSIAVK